MLYLPAALAALAPVGATLHAQAINQVTQAVDSARVQALPNHLPLWANAANDAGSLPPDRVLGQMTVVLSRSLQQEQSFDSFLADQQDPTSPEYHHWLTPAEVGDRFGLSQQDIAAVTGWLQSQGLHVNWISPSRIFIGFGGTAADLGRALRTELHSYTVNGKVRISANSDPMVPQALSPVIKAIRGLYTVEERPLHRAESMQSDSPLMTSGGSHYIAPADFATIYSLPSSISGTGQSIGIVGRSRTDFADFNNFRQLTGSNFPNPTEIVPTAFGGVDPGPAYTTPQGPSVDTGDQGEATLDVMRAGSVAPGANLLLIVDTSASGDIYADAEYLVQTSPPPAQIMTISFGLCESEAGPAEVGSWDTLFKQAAAEGISAFVSSGDSGASGCDYAFTTPPASPDPNSPNFICSSSYVTCVGGTEFNDTTNPSTYWNSSSGSNLSSALSYIPEGAWNEPLNGSDTEPASSGGGVSSVIATPSWQTGTGVPAARSGRYTPDISFSAAMHDGYFGCFAADGGSCVVSNGFYSFMGFAGTSAAAPSMAGIAALLNQSMEGQQGNLNPTLYSLAVSAPTAFNDVTVASSGVSNCNINTPSMCNNSVPSASGLSGGQAGYLVTTGYDEVTGLGSLNVQNFLSNFTSNLPKVIGAPSATGITNTGASLSGTVNPNGSGTQAWFQYATNSSFTGASTTSQQGLPSGTSNVVFNAPLSSLTSNTTYYFRVLASNSYGTVNGTTASFTTTAVPQAPTVTTGGYSGVTGTTANVGGIVNPNRSDTLAWFQYATNSSFTGASTTTQQDLASGSSNVIFSAPLSGLTANTLYYFRAVASNSLGTVNGAAASFTTTAPQVQSFSIGNTSLTVKSGATTGNTSSIVVTPSAGFSGSVMLAATVTSSPTGAVNPPTFSFSTNPVVITSATAQTSTLTITTTAPTTASLDPSKRSRFPWYASGGATLACVLLFAIPSRRWRTILGTLTLFAVLCGGVVSCSGGKSTTTTSGSTSAPGTTTGSYTITVTGVSGTSTSNGTVTLVVQ